MGNGAEQKALLRLARHDDASRTPPAHGRVARIEPQSGGLRLTVAGVAAAGEEGANPGFEEIGFVEFGAGRRGGEESGNQ